MATYSGILARKIPWTEEPGGLQSMRSQKSWTQLSMHTPGEPGMQPRDPCLPWRGILGPGHTPRCTTRISGSLSCGAREVRSPCAWRGGARPGSRVTYSMKEQASGMCQTGLAPYWPQLSYCLSIQTRTRAYFMTQMVPALGRWERTRGCVSPKAPASSGRRSSGRAKEYSENGGAAAARCFPRVKTAFVRSNCNSYCIRDTI